MPGYEVIDEQEKKAVLEVFEKSNGIIWDHAFDDLRKGIYRVRDLERIKANLSALTVT